MPEVKLQPGDRIGPLEKGPIDKVTLVKYAGASGDFNPIHVDEEFARKAGYEKNFAHGMLTMGYLGQLLTDTFGPGAVLAFSVRFARIVWLGDSVKCYGEVAAADGHKLTLKVWAENQHREKVVTGEATVKAGTPVSA